MTIPWKSHLEANRHLVDVLVQGGCTAGEALVLLELNHMNTLLQKMIDGPKESWEDDD